jgi:purine-binding chemotaxis protein CheW
MSLTQHKYVTFNVGQYSFGIDVLDVREINHHIECTPVPLAPKHIRGLINLRGQVVTLLDLREMFGLGKIEITEETHNIILKNEHFATTEEEEGNRNDRVGFMVDRIGDILTIEEEDREAPPANVGEIDGQYLTHVIKQGSLVVSVLNVRLLLSYKGRMLQSA